MINYVEENGFIESLNNRIKEGIAVFLITSENISYILQIINMIYDTKIWFNFEVRKDESTGARFFLFEIKEIK